MRLPRLNKHFEFAMEVRPDAERVLQELVLHRSVSAVIPASLCQSACCALGWHAGMLSVSRGVHLCGLTAGLLRMLAKDCLFGHVACCFRCAG